MKRVPSFSNRPDFPQGLKVLLLCSDPQIRGATVQQLKACTYEVSPVGSASEASALLEQTGFDLILAESDDLLHEKVDTQHFTTKAANVPLLLMSESECSTHVFRGIKLGAADFLKRPLSELKLKVIWQHAVRKATQPSDTITPSEINPLMENRSVFSNVGITPCQYPGDMSTSNPLEVTNPGESGASGFDVAADNVAGNQNSEDNLVTGTDYPSGDPDPSICRQRKVHRDVFAPNIPSGPLPPLNLGVPPLMGIPPGCIPPVSSDGSAVGMPILNQPPFSTPPLGLGQMSNVGNVPLVPFPNYPMVPLPTGPSSGQPSTPWPGVSMGRSHSVSEVSLTTSRENEESGEMAVDIENSDLSPLGLTLRKSPSLVNMISKNLEGFDMDV